jgi:hypothetical protein
MALQSGPCLRALQQWQKRREILFYIFFFASSTNLATCSFDHLCKEQK